jgi:hypothetical protein
MDQTVARAKRRGLISKRPEGIADATGLSADGRSSYYAQKLRRSKGSSGKRGKRYPITKWPKINAIVDAQSHLFIAASVSEGPSHDSPELPGLLAAACGRLTFDRLLADSGYDASSIGAGGVGDSLDGDRAEPAQSGAQMAAGQIPPADEAAIPQKDLWQPLADRKHLEPAQTKTGLGALVED